ncbi:hypothetical protein NKI96_22870 [Mesorhizobium sp. M0292]|uniref:Uncharacterized protein n=1 Tax=Mesorhizobium caraganae TaxID=483206 RepID=A0ABV1Z6T1_9HYPH
MDALAKDIRRDIYADLCAAGDWLITRWAMVRDAALQGCDDRVMVGMYNERKQIAHEEGHLAIAPVIKTLPHIRQYFPKGTNLSIHSADGIAAGAMTDFVVTGLIKRRFAASFR